MRGQFALLTSVVASVAGFVAAFYVVPSLRLRDATTADSGNAIGLIDFSATEVNAGKAIDLSERQFLFSLQNISSEAVVIDTVASDCTCIQATHERVVQPGATSEIAVTIRPSPHKVRYVVNVQAKQGRHAQSEKLTVVFESVESNSVVFDPPTVMIGELVAERPFNIKRAVRIVAPNGDSVRPISVLGPEWGNVDLEQDEGNVTLLFSGIAPVSFAINRDVIELLFPEPLGRASLEFAYALRPQYIVEPHRAFGFAGKDGGTARAVELKGLGVDETVQWAVAMESPGALEVSRESRLGYFRLTPVFAESVDEVSGSIAWTVYTESNVAVGACQSEFCFIRPVQIDYRHDED